MERYSTVRLGPASSEHTGSGFTEMQIIDNWSGKLVAHFMGAMAKRYAGEFLSKHQEESYYRDENKPWNVFIEEDK